MALADQMRAKHNLAGAKPELTGSMCGYLLKRGKINTAFKRRWFAVHRERACLDYHKELGSARIDSIPLGGAQVSLVEEKGEWQIHIEVLSGRKYVLQGEAPNPLKKLDVWVGAISDVMSFEPLQVCYLCSPFPSSFSVRSQLRAVHKDTVTVMAARVEWPVLLFPILVCGAELLSIGAC